MIAKLVRGSGGGLVLAAALVVAALSPHDAPAGSYTDLYSHLVDLDGWDAEDPEGMAMDYPGMKLVYAMRRYAGKEGSFEVVLMLGGSKETGGMMQPGMMPGMMKMESDEGEMELQEIDGFQVQTYLDKEEGAGAVHVILWAAEEGIGGALALTFEGITTDEAIEIAKKFDWKEIKKSLEALE